MQSSGRLLPDSHPRGLLFAAEMVLIRSIHSTKVVVEDS
jgi:hypothetical protein